jgi:hypothetical protein
MPDILLLFLDRGRGVEWILKLAAAGDEDPCVDIMEVSKPDDLGDIARVFWMPRTSGPIGQPDK